MTLCFVLTMPNVGSWNGRWSGEGNLYAIVKTFSKSKKSDERCARLLAARSWHYRWDDGWGANISVKQVNNTEARAIRRNTKGFCGYDWMVNNILNHGSPYQKEAAKEEAIP